MLLFCGAAVANWLKRTRIFAKKKEHLRILVLTIFLRTGECAFFGHGRVVVVVVINSLSISIEKNNGKRKREKVVVVVRLDISILTSCDVSIHSKFSAAPIL